MTTTDPNVVPGRGETTLPTRLDAGDVIAEVLWNRLFNRDHAAIPKARSVAQLVVAELRREGLITGTRAAASHEVLAAVQNRAAQFGEAPIRGISHLVAEALVLLDLPVVHRDVIESLLPDLDTSQVKNTVAMQFKRALRKFHGWKWIDRRNDGLISIIDRDALTRWFTMADDLNEHRAATTLDLAKAVRRLNMQVSAGDVDEVRRRELLMLQKVMRSAPGAVTNERGSVRVVPASSPF